MQAFLNDIYEGAEADAAVRRGRDGRAAVDRCIEEYLSLDLADERRAHLTRVISFLSFQEETRLAS